MSMNSTLDALTKIMKPTTSDDDMQVDQQHGSNSDDGNLQQRLSNLKTPTAEELVAKAQQLTERMTEFNIEEEDYTARYQMRQKATKQFNTLVQSLPTTPDPENPEWVEKAKRVWLACEDMDKWLEENEGDYGYSDVEEVL